MAIAQTSSTDMNAAVYLDGPVRTVKLISMNANQTRVFMVTARMNRTDTNVNVILAGLVSTAKSISMNVNQVHAFTENA
jgi:tRNA pseudouridine-54 N-methylase